MPRAVSRAVSRALLGSEGGDRPSSAIAFQINIAAVDFRYEVTSNYLRPTITPTALCARGRGRMEDGRYEGKGEGALISLVDCCCDGFMSFGLVMQS